MDIKGGWILDEDFEVFRIPIRIINPETSLSIIKTCLFDTGFTGYLGLDKETIEKLNLSKIGIGKGLTIKGLVDFDNYEANIEIIDNEDNTLIKINNIDDSDVESENDRIPIQEFKIPIIGMKSIRQINWMILSKRKALFILK